MKELTLATIRQMLQQFEESGKLEEYLRSHYGTEEPLRLMEQYKSLIQHLKQ